MNDSKRHRKKPAKKRDFVQEPMDECQLKLNVGREIPYFCEANEIKYAMLCNVVKRLKAIRALKEYHATRKVLDFELKENVVNSLSECYAQLKKLLFHYVEAKQFILASNVYKLLGEVACYAHDYARAIKYYTQSVNHLYLLYRKLSAAHSPEEKSNHICSKKSVIAMLD